MTGGPGEKLRWKFVVTHLLNRYEASILTISPGCDHPFITYEQASVSSLSDQPHPFRDLMLVRCHGGLLLGIFGLPLRRKFFRSEELLSEDFADNLALDRLHVALRTSYSILRKVTEDLVVRSVREIRLIFSHRVIPEDLHRRHQATCREVKPQHRLCRKEN